MERPELGSEDVSTSNTVRIATMDSDMSLAVDVIEQGRQDDSDNDPDDSDDKGGDDPPEARRDLDPRFALYRETGDHKIRNQLIEDHRWLAVHCARRFAHKGEPLDDLVQVAMVGILKAVERFDPGFGVVFTTFAVPTVVGELRRHFRDKTWAVHVPRRAKETYQTVSTVVDELSQMLGRSPTVPEIADRANLTVEDALEALEVGGAYRGVPLSPPTEQEQGESMPLGDADPGFEATEAKMTVHGLLDALPDERERRIIKLRFFDGLTQSQIAAEIGVSQVQISRLLRASLEKMRCKLATERV
jgi:RNA polymerase sigma-B factor